jgi:acyl-coenzyme A thioesterase PaaI-like protein
LDQLVSPTTPEGFVPRPAGGPFLDPIGPIMIRRDLGPLAFGLRIEKRHCNSKDMAHGGMLATFADLALGIGGFHLAGVKGFFTTISLNSDYLAPALLGTWLQCEPVLLRKTRTLVFAQGVCMADGKPVLRASGVFALPKDPPPQPIGG